MTRPALESADVLEGLEGLLARGSSRRLVAFYGSGEAGELEPVDGERFRVQPVESELDLRSRLPSLSSDEGIVFLVPMSGEVPLDIAGRFMRRGKVQKVGRESRLQRLFGVQAVDPEVLSSPLAEHVLASPPPPCRLPEGRLTLDALWRVWLGSSYGVDTSGGLALDRLLAWAATREPRGEGLTEELREALESHLERCLGAAGPLVRRAWEAGRGVELLAVAAVLDALGETPSEAGLTWIDLRFEQEFGVEDSRGAARALGRAAAGALRALEAADEKTVVFNVLARADALVGKSLRPAVLGSTWLPSAWEWNLGLLGKVLQRAAKKSGYAVVREAIELKDALGRHRFSRGKSGLSTFERVEMAVRLAAWLHERRDRDVPGGEDHSSFSDAVRLGRWYVEEGCWVDWARHRARRTADNAFARGVTAVVEQVDEERRQLDLAFARGLRAWVEAGQPAQDVLPIDMALHKTAAAFLGAEAQRRLLVILVDGMGWAQAAELLLSLGEDSIRWAPLAWHDRPPGRLGESPYPVVFAALPSVTRVSRAAFWSGRRPQRGKKAGSTGDDPKRWAAHRSMRKFFTSPSSTSRSSRLFLREEGFTKDGTVRPEALRAIESKEERVVAFVVNAVDSWLKSDPQQHHDWKVDAIHTLRAMLDKAREADRAVLLASDHGHVPGDRLVGVSRGAAEGGARWREWSSAEEPLEEWEVGFEAESVWAPPGAHGVALLADDGHRWGSANHAGEHGGATLAEVVCPTVVLGSEPLQIFSGDDTALHLRDVKPPPWWWFDQDPTRSSKKRPAASVGVPWVAPPKPSVHEGQMRLGLEPELPAPSGEATEAASWKDHALASSKIFEQQTTTGNRAETLDLRDRVLKAVDYLERRNGVAGAEAFSRALGVSPNRVAGLVSRLSRVLNYDQYQVLRFDERSRQVELEVAKLKELFEL